jgi:hypothetical protein
MLEGGLTDFNANTGHWAPIRGLSNREVFHVRFNTNTMLCYLDDAGNTGADLTKADQPTH